MQTYFVALGFNNVLSPISLTEISLFLMVLAVIKSRRTIRNQITEEQSYIWFLKNYSKLDED